MSAKVFWVPLIVILCICKCLQRNFNATKSFILYHLILPVWPIFAGDRIERKATSKPWHSSSGLLSPWFPILVSWKPVVWEFVQTMLQSKFVRRRDRICINFSLILIRILAILLLFIFLLPLLFFWRCRCVFFFFWFLF